MGFHKDGLKGSKLRVFTEGEVQAIHGSSLTILEELGMEIDDDDILKLLKKAGCKVDFSTGISRVPPGLVEETLSETPNRIRLCGRNAENDIVLGDGMVYARTPGGPPYIIDLDTEKRREATIHDLELCCRLADALENINGMSIFQVVPMDVPRLLLDVYAAEASFLNSEKHFFYYTQNEELVDYVIEMAAIVAGGEDKLKARPLLSGFCEITSPLKLEWREAKLLRSFVRGGLPVYTHSHPIAGLTSPVTLAGEVALMNAETLMVVVISQLVSPGTPIFYGTSASVPDMRKVLNLAGAVEVGLLGCALAQMASRYRLPSAMTSGTDAKVPDAQAAMERILTALPPILAGLDLVNLSTTDSKMTFSPALLVIDNELMTWIGRLLRGIAVNKETLAVELIKEVAGDGTFISHKHTIRHFKEELQESRLVSREAWSDWKAAGSKTLHQKAQGRAQRIMDEHRPEPLSKETQHDIAQVKKSAERLTL